MQTNDEPCLGCGECNPIAFISNEATYCIACAKAMLDEFEVEKNDRPDTNGTVRGTDN